MQWMTLAPALVLGVGCADAGTATTAPTARPLFAVTGTTCSTELEAVRTAITSSEFQNEKDRQSALTKLAAAQAKLSQNKAADAVAKLTDLETSVQALIAAGKLVENPESSLTGSLEDAVACINTANAG